MVLILKRQDVLHDSWLRAARKKKIALLYTSPSYSYFLISLGFPLSLLVPFSSPGRRQPESTAQLSVLPRNTIQRLSPGSELHCLIYSPVHTWVSCPRIRYSDSVKALNYTFWTRVQWTIYYSIRSRATLLSNLKKVPVHLWSTFSDIWVMVLATKTEFLTSVMLPA